MNVEGAEDVVYYLLFHFQVRGFGFWGVRGLHCVIGAGSWKGGVELMGVRWGWMGWGVLGLGVG